MIHKQLIIIGGGPSGLCAAKTALDQGIDTLIIERSSKLGGQLIKQTHKFFGSKNQYARMRGYDIAQKLISDLNDYEGLEILLNTHVVGLYSENVVTTYDQHTYQKYQADAIVIATGASEKFLGFENNDLPGIYGAGAIQTLMNLYGVLPGNEVVMVGSGNIGLIVSYQLMQAGVHVKAIIEAAGHIGGYKVHASKMRRLGVPILTKTTVKKAIGTDHIEQIMTVKLDDHWKEIPGTEEIIDVDALCISVGLSPLYQLVSMSGAQTKYIPELGGFVPIINEHHQTTIPSIFSCGDAVGIEEASSAMMEGYLTGLHVANFLTNDDAKTHEMITHYEKQLSMLRDGPFGKKTRVGLQKMMEGEHHA